MQPTIKLLPEELIDRILDEAFQLMVKTGIKVQSSEARNLLSEADARIDEGNNIAYIPEKTIRQALQSTPQDFSLYSHAGEAAVHYGGDQVQFDPGSSAVHMLDSDTLEHRPARTSDLIRLVKLAEKLPQYEAQSTAVVCSEIPKEIGDLYRLYIVLRYSTKPIVTGAFSIKTLKYMIEMLKIMCVGQKGLNEKPRAVFDVCPSPPLIWSEFGCQNLIELAKAGVPTQIVSMPLAGAAAPVTLLGSVVQHTAECLSGITIHQLARPGAPIVWGGAPAIFDMRQGTTPMGAMETAMIDVCYAQVGKSLNLPTHTYLGASDAKIVDYQAGLESGISAVIGALAGINMISGAGMLDFLACQSIEKLVIDAEGIAMAKRLLEGVQERTKPLALQMFTGINFKGDFLKQKITRELFPLEQHIPSPVIDRSSIRGWQSEGSLDTFSRAKKHAQQLLAGYQTPDLPAEGLKELDRLVFSLAKESGVDDIEAYIQD
ncbi:MAG: trimethylamine methyltransferase family protein [Anaerolineales bacterium]|nr:trimethylamine methyltransferase family protein [Anaerolineales bacterium]